MHNVLATTGLLTMLLEQRTKPKSTAMNIYGFTLPHMYDPAIAHAIEDDIDNDSVSTYALSISNEPIPIGEDDFGLWSYDKARLMRLVEVMFDKSLHSYGEKYKINNDPIGYYKAIMKIVFSDRPRERTDATNAFMQYKIERNSTIAEEQVRWTEVVTTYNDLHKQSPITSDAMLSFLQRIYEGDTRQYISSPLFHGRLEQWTYEHTVAQMLEMEQQMSNQRRPASIGAMTDNGNRNNNNRNNYRNDNNNNNGKSNNEDKYANNKDRGYCRNWWKQGYCSTPNCTYIHNYNTKDQSLNPFVKKAGGDNCNDNNDTRSGDPRNDNESSDHRNNRDNRNNNRSDRNDQSNNQGNNRGNNRSNDYRNQQSNSNETHPNKGILKPIPVDNSHRSNVAFAINEENINLVGQPNGDNTATGWARSQFA